MQAYKMVILIFCNSSGSIAAIRKTICPSNMFILQLCAKPPVINYAFARTPYTSKINHVPLYL